MPRFEAETRDSGDPCWHPVDRTPPAWRRESVWPLLSEQGPLTARIRSRCPDTFHLELMSESASVLDAGSAEWLGEPAGSPAHEREVRLWCGDRPVVYGNTLFPDRLDTSDREWLEQLGTRPLGDAFFALPGGRRRGLNIARIEPGSPLARRALRGMARPPVPSGGIWVRRSLLEADTLCLLVTECLLEVRSE